MPITFVIVLNLIFVLIAAIPVLGIAVWAAREQGRNDRLARARRAVQGQRQAPARARRLPASPATIR